MENATTGSAFLLTYLSQTKSLVVVEQLIDKRKAPNDTKIRFPVVDSCMNSRSNI